jgi:hypothetical protein
MANFCNPITDWNPLASIFGSNATPHCFYESLCYCRIFLRHRANQMLTLFVYFFFRYQWSPLQTWLSFEAVLMKILLLLMVDAMAVV